MEFNRKIETARRSLKRELDRRWSRYTKYWNPRGPLPAAAVAAIEPLVIALARLNDSQAAQRGDRAGTISSRRPRNSAPSSAAIAACAPSSRIVA